MVNDLIIKLILYLKIGYILKSNSLQKEKLSEISIFTYKSLEFSYLIQKISNKFLKLIMILNF